MLQDGLFNLLANASSITAIVGTPTTRADGRTGIFKVQIPEEAPLPAVAFFQIGGESLFSMDGPDALRFERFQFSCQAKTPQDAATLQRAVRRLLENYTGVLIDGSVVQNIEAVLVMEAFDMGPSTFDAPLDVRITFQDSGT